MAGEPTAASEFRRGLHPYNLMVGAASALAAGAGAALATAAGLTPDLLAHGAPLQGVSVAAAVFALVTALHTAGHTYFGWRFARGLRAARAGDHAAAIRLLAPVERRGIEHYDPDGHVRRALAASRAAASA